MIAADGAVWTEAALLHDAVEKVSLLFTERQAALAHAVSDHHHPTSQGNVDPLQLYAKTWQFASFRSQTTCPRRVGGGPTRQRATLRRAGRGRILQSTFDRTTFLVRAHCCSMAWNRLTWQVQHRNT